MKNIIFLVLLVLFCFGSCKVLHQSGKKSQEASQDQVHETGIQPSVNYSDQSTWLLGYFNPGQLSQPPHSEWYLKGYNEYQPSREAVEALSLINKNDLTITVVMGTWCPDSRREVPRFMRILDLWNFPMENVTFIGVDNTKLAPIADYDTLNIERVPTFIFLKNKVEAGRIIENPETSLEQDMVNILTRNEN